MILTILGPYIYVSPLLAVLLGLWPLQKADCHLHCGEINPETVLSRVILDNQCLSLQQNSELQLQFAF